MLRTPFTSALSATPPRAARSAAGSRWWIRLAVCVLAVGWTFTEVRAQDASFDFMAPPAESDDPEFPVCVRGEACSELDNIKWADDIHAAMELGQAQKKPVLIVFSARQQEPGLDDDF